MRLPQFIAQHSESILEEFEEFARTHTAAGMAMDVAALRDHAAAMLGTIARDMGQPQSDAAQARKSRGDAPVAVDPTPTAAEQHGTDRADSGFTLQEMFAEYRALRASVLRLWAAAPGRHLDHTDIQDLIRFNEAIDQSLAESITQFSTGLDRYREMFLAILGHDLRSPLGAVISASSFLLTAGDLEGRNLTMAARIRSSSERMNTLVGDLLDFTRARLGRGIPISRENADIAEIGRQTVDEIAGQNPEHEVRFETSGDVRGRWDAQRLSQALTNLVGNAVTYGAGTTPITVRARGEADEVVISIHNRGSAISPADQRRIFDPFKRVASEERSRRPQESLGLGLYIAQQIAASHGGMDPGRFHGSAGNDFRAPVATARLIRAPCGSKIVASRPGKETSLTLGR
jgi:signal transduction histidine kinase